MKNINESDLLGYFETIKSVFLLKLLLLTTITRQKDQKKYLKLPDECENIIPELVNRFDNPLFFKALRSGNEALILNYLEDIVSSATSGSWIVFEQIIKTLTNGAYAEEAQQISINYEKGIFQFTKKEKKNISLFCYLRNSMLHYNGSYFSYRSINHRYKNWEFKSDGNIGNKIIISPEIVYEIICDLESYSMKAWNNAK